MSSKITRTVLTAAMLLASGLFSVAASVKGKVDDINGLRLSIASSTMDSDGAFKKLLAYTSDREIIIRAGSFAAIGVVAKHLTDSQREMAVDSMMDGLNDSALVVQRESARALGECGPTAEKAVPPLLSVAEGKIETDASLFAIRALGKIGRRQDIVVPVLIKMAGEANDDPERQHWEAIPAIQALASFPDDGKAIAADLDKYVGTKNFDLLAALAETISTVDPGNHDLESIIETLLSSNNLQHRIAGIEAIDRIPILSEAEIRLLKSAKTNDPSPAIRSMAEVGSSGFLMARRDE